MPYFYPAVYTKETNLSNIVQAASSSVGAIVFGSKKGPLGWTLATSDKQFSDIYGNPDPSVSMAHYCAKDFLRFGKQLWCNRVVNGSTYPILAYDSIANTLTAQTAAADPTAYAFPAATVSNAQTFIVYPIGPGTYAQDAVAGYSIKVDQINATAGTFNISVYSTANTNVALEVWTVSKNKQLDGFGRQQFLETAINGNSAYIKVLNNAAVTGVGSGTGTSAVAFSGASDGSAVGDSQLVSGWSLLVGNSNVMVNVLINGGYATAAVQQQMDTTCQQRGDCFAVLDMPSASQAVSNALTYRNTTLNLNSSYSGLYTPDYLRYDPYTDQQVWVPPSGQAAATMAYTDYVRNAGWAPAGSQRGLIQDALDLRYHYQDGDLASLYPAQINPLVAFPGQQAQIYGQKTLASQASSLQYINVRRILLVMERSMASALRVALFEPNDEFTRSQVTEMLVRYLTGLVAGRALYAFKVVCDTSNNTPTSIDARELHVDVYLQVEADAEYIVLNSVLTRTGANINEIITRKAA